MDLKLEQNLDQDQLNAVLSTEKRLLVMANAGSGKTRMLTFRAANFIASSQASGGFTQYNIMMLTFTKKAANEMRERIGKILGDENLKITAGTFHGIACRMIRQYATYAMLPERFSIFDTDDSKLWLRTAISDILNENPDWKKIKDRPTAEFIQKEYSRCRNTRDDFEKVVTENYDGPDDPRTKICLEAIQRYENTKRGVPALDFDDLLTTFNQMLSNPAFREIMHARFPAVFVDEYQDINIIQHEIIAKLTGPNSYLTAVGDDAQCIYGFRGSNVKFIKQFTRNFPDGRVLYLPKNYRSTANIVNTAAAVLNDSIYLDGDEKVMTSVRNDPSPEVTCLSLYNETQQADYIRDSCRNAKRQGMRWGDMAVLVRTKNDANKIEAALLKAGIPVSKECGTEFYDREQIKMVVKFLQVLYTPNNKAALAALIAKCPHVGQKTIDKMFDALVQSGYKFSAMKAISPPGKNVNQLYQGIVEAFETAEDLMSTGCKEPKVLAEDLIEKFVIPWCKHFKYIGDRQEEQAARLIEVDQLVESLSVYPDLESFIDNVTLDTSMDEKPNEPVDEAKAERLKDGKVRIMTIHKSKGLEFRKVFLPNMSQGLTPSAKQMGIVEEMQEELHVVYVAMTRAMDELDILSVRRHSRMKGPFGEPVNLEPSEFFDNLEFAVVP